MNGDDRKPEHEGSVGPGAPGATGPPPPTPPGRPPLSPPPGPPHLGYGWGTPGYPGWETRPKKGFFQRHPLLVVVLFLGFFVGLTIVVGVMATSGRSGMPSVGGFGKKVGVIKVEGLIVESKSVVDQIHRFRDDDSIVSVVLRVDSPGGTVAASQEIFDEVGELADKKPVVVSMGTVAASGGYYISCPATAIYANPGTITGSIGVIMQLTNLEDFMDWIKIRKYTIKSGKWKDAGSPYREMREEEREYLQEFVDDLHAQFEKAVAEGRGLSAEEVSELANGKIYNGSQALELGLVDELGNLWDAIAAAAERGGIKGDPRVVWPPRPRPNLFESFMGKLLPGFVTEEVLPRSTVRALYLLDPGMD